MGERGEVKVKRVKVHANPWKSYQVTSKLLVRLGDANEVPPTLPDGTPLLTKSEKMGQDFEEAGLPMKGAKDD